jgi:ATP synthase protein I
MESSKNEGADFFGEQIAKKEKQKLEAKKVNAGSVWTGLGMFGMIGWSVAVPTLLGAALGIWLDKNHSESFSWVLTFLMVGLITGCIIAGYWVAQEDKEMHQNKKDNDE